MSPTDEKRLNALREAATNSDWDSFRDTLTAWRDEDPDNEWLTTGIQLAHSLAGDDVSDDDRKALQRIDQRTFEQLAALNSIRSGDADAARDAIACEISRNPRDSAWVSAYRFVIGEADDSESPPSSLEPLVSGCVIRESQILSIAAESATIPADALVDRTDLMWDELQELSSRIGLGAIRGFRAVAEDGTWIVASDEQDPPIIASVVSSPEAVCEGVAQAQCAIEGPEAKG